ncbi:hypothetical protein [Neisseria musculi]|uniref:hypothetical protein n=1 Tax=Neisseria musculi TaxID=1815583 RepID=UPI00164C81AA|nr:hypothetical protein [Neisseria musculi]
MNAPRFRYGRGCARPKQNGVAAASAATEPAPQSLRRLRFAALRKKQGKPTSRKGRASEKPFRPSETFQTA